MVEEKLRERIKELSCLYDINKIAKATDKPIDAILQAIVARIPEAFQNEKDAICELRINEEYYVSKELPEQTVILMKSIDQAGNKIGDLHIHYPAEFYQNSVFLKEEEQLLERLADEISDIFERHRIKMLEEQYLQKFVKQNRLMVLEEITGSIAHELNTPLANIFGFTEFILQSERSPQTLADAQKIMDSATHASEIVKKLMYFSCDLPNRFELNSLQKLTESALQMLRPTIDKAMLSVVLESELTVNDFMQLDAVQFTQVIFNLVSNAIAASQKNTEVKVKLWQADKVVYLQVCDQGSGIDPEALGKVFDPFFTTKDIGDGMGLGLSVVHGIVKSHQGNISVESKLGVGTCFTVQLPVRN